MIHDNKNAKLGSGSAAKEELICQDLLIPTLNKCNTELEKIAFS